LGLLFRNGILPGAKFTLLPSLRYPILAALLHGTPAVGVSQTLRHGIFTRQGGHPVQHWAVELSSLIKLSKAIRTKQPYGLGVQLNIVTYFFNLVSTY